MQFVRFAHGGSDPGWGLLEEETIHVLRSSPRGPPRLEDFANPTYRRWVATAAERNTFVTIPAAETAFLAPVPRPGKIVAAGLNYRDHAEEQDADLPEQPQLFTKAPTSVINPQASIVLPGAVDQVDYEVELGVVIGKMARQVDADDARSVVAGYTVLNDVSARDAQFADGQNFRGKSYDTFCPMGPIIVTEDQFDPHTADVRLRVNGETKQSSNTEQLIFDVDDLIEYISGVMTLLPGDVIATGTPGGVGIFREPPELLEPGDTVETEVDGIGTLINPVVAE